MSNEISNEVGVSSEVEVVEVDRFAGLKFGKESFAQLVELVREQQARIEALESKNQTSSTKREMTIADAEAVMIGEHRAKTHNECATILGLSYGQIYSARVGQTFKPTTVEMLAQNLPMIWGKKAKVEAVAAVAAE